MASRRRLVLFFLATALLAAPALAVASQICVGCCCASAPCDASEAQDAPCLTYSGGPCCDDAAPALPSARKPASEAPAFHACAPARRILREEARVPLSPPGEAETWGRSSPLRLSVVLRI